MENSNSLVSSLVRRGSSTCTLTGPVLPGRRDSISGLRADANEMDGLTLPWKPNRDRRQEIIDVRWAWEAQCKMEQVPEPSRGIYSAKELG